jgi:hypothetical protein
VALYESLDGGVTWAEQEAKVPVESFLTGVAKDGLIVGSIKRRGLESTIEYSLHPSGQPLTPPTGVGSATPYPDREGAIGWLSTSAPGGFFTNDGTLLVPPSPDMRLVRVLYLGGGRLAQWISDRTQVFGMFHGTGELAGAFRDDQYADFRGQLPDGLLYGNVELAETFGFGVDGGSDACKASQHIYPALVNWTTGSIHPIHELGDCVEGRHKFVNAMLSQAVVRVVTGADCLNVRKDPTTLAESLGCYADGVLLMQRFEGVSAQVEGWLPVLTAASEPGWVAEEFVAR